MKRVVTVVTGLMLFLSLGIFIQGAMAKTTKSKNMVIHQVTGTISSVEGNQLVLSHMMKGKEEQSTFVINDQTKKQGECKSGEKATIHYKVENGKDVATMVKVSGGKAKS